MTTLPAVVRIIDLPAYTTVTGGELFEAVQTVAGEQISVQIPATAIMTSSLGGLPTGGGTAQILGKSSASNFSTAWYDVASFVSTISTSGLATSGTGTGLILAIATGGVGSTQLGAMAVQSSNVTTNAIGDAQFRQGSPLSVVGVAGSATANVADIAASAPGQVLSVNAGGTGLLFTTLSFSLATNVTITGTLTVLGQAGFSAGVISTGIFNQTGTTLATGTFGIVGTTLVTGVFGVVGTSLFTGVYGIVGTTLITGRLGVVGTAVVTGLLSVSRSVIAGADGAATSFLYIAGNNGATHPTTGGSGAVGWNFSGGAAEVVFFNAFTAASISFDFRQMTSATTSLLLVRLGTAVATFSQNLAISSSLILSAQTTGLAVSNSTGLVSATTNMSFGLTFNTYSVGNIGTTTFTATPINGNYQRYFNNAAHTVSSFTTADHAIDVLVTNTAGAGAITFNGFTVNTSNIGDALTTTNGNQFIIALRRMGGTATYVIKALQ